MNAHNKTLFPCRISHFNTEFASSSLLLSLIQHSLPALRKAGAFSLKRNFSQFFVYSIFELLLSPCVNAQRHITFCRTHFFRFSDYSYFFSKQLFLFFSFDSHMCSSKSVVMSVVVVNIVVLESYIFSGSSLSLPLRWTIALFLCAQKRMQTLLSSL